MFALPIVVPPYGKMEDRVAVVSTCDAPPPVGIVIRWKTWVLSFCFQVITSVSWLIESVLAGMKAMPPPP